MLFCLTGKRAVLPVTANLIIPNLTAIGDGDSTHDAYAVYE